MLAHSVYLIRRGEYDLNPPGPPPHTTHPSHLFFHLFPIHILYDHLCHTMSAQRLAPLERLSLHTGQRIEHGRNKQHHRRRNQTRNINRDADPLYNAHDKVDGRAHVVGLEFADEVIEDGGSWANAQEERDLDEDYDEGADSETGISLGAGNWENGGLGR